MKKLILFSLFLALPLVAKDYKGAEIRTNDSFLYGKFEIKMKSCDASGMLMSFFTFYDNPDFTTRWNEIDIEILGRYQNEVQFNAIVGKHEMHEKRQVLDFNPHKDFHWYAFEWTPEYIAWFVDEKEVYRQTGEHIARMNQKQKIMMNIWPSQFWEWTGPWEKEKIPLYAQYDHFKYYEYTPKSSSKFTLSWEDSFDRIDNSRWSFATHTFDGNNCDFTPTNATVKDGILILALTEGEYQEEVTIPKEEKSGFSEVQISKVEYINSSTLKVSFTGKVNKINAKKENFVLEGVQIQKSKFSLEMNSVELVLSNYEFKEGAELIFTPPSGSLATQVQKVKLQRIK
jgi:endoglucanase